ncbi:hypothetical protein GF1_11120 [Desulfolithobacter dissulfuricans]|uniref:Uncharacterized protein n=1 Tax=Desulfolithobacter dissulfuricans TaxID=2795293 RepID=A0A915U999_9BACT|nr:hypothetical protein [Desulfolithobacter dissulfuricans]BCO08736.1 hypothetical protein GF1_11120 [Desulfolithobacter dissulfuricans]
MNDKAPPRPGQQKELLGNLISSLLQDLDHGEKKKLLQQIIDRSEKEHSVVDMVEY